MNGLASLPYWRKFELRQIEPIRISRETLLGFQEKHDILGLQLFLIKKLLGTGINQYEINKLAGLVIQDPGMLQGYKVPTNHIELY